MDDTQLQTKKPKRTDLLPPEGDRVSAVDFNHSERLEYNGKTYIKMSRIIKNLTMSSQTARKEIQLWLCIEAGGTFPARTVIVPEFLK